VAKNLRPSPENAQIMHFNFLHKYDYRRRLSEADLMDFIEGDLSKLSEAGASAVEEMGEYLVARSPLNQIFLNVQEYRRNGNFRTGQLVWENKTRNEAEDPPQLYYYRGLHADSGQSPLSSADYWQLLPRDPRSTIIRDFAVDIALYRLIPANSPVEIMNQFRQFYDDAIAWCKVYMKNTRPTRLPQKPPENRGILIKGGSKVKGKSNGDRNHNRYDGW